MDDILVISVRLWLSYWVFFAKHCYSLCDLVCVFLFSSCVYLIHLFASCQCVVETRRLLKCLLGYQVVPIPPTMSTESTYINEIIWEQCTFLTYYVNIGSICTNCRLLRHFMSNETIFDWITRSHEQCVLTEYRHRSPEKARHWLKEGGKSHHMT